MAAQQQFSPSVKNLTSAPHISCKPPALYPILRCLLEYERRKYNHSTAFVSDLIDTCKFEHTISEYWMSFKGSGISQDRSQFKL